MRRNLSGPADVSDFCDPARPSDPPSAWLPGDPFVELEYPGDNACERFTLLQPRHLGDEYNPILDLISVVRNILDELLTPEQSQQIFAHTHTPHASRPDPFIPPDPPQLSADSPPDSIHPRRERAAQTADGPAFLEAVVEYNVQITTLRHQKAFVKNVAAMPGLDDRLWTRVAAQAYERTVGPEIGRLKAYVAFSDNVYGELLPRLVADIVHLTDLGPGKLMVDLGSGVGNCCVQASLASGCDSIGFEIMDAASELADAQRAEFEARCALWGLNSGKVETIRADFCKDERVGQAMARADVVICNNYVFGAKTNETLSNLFLDLRDGACVSTAATELTAQLRRLAQAVRAGELLTLAPHHRLAARHPGPAAATALVPDERQLDGRDGHVLRRPRRPLAHRTLDRGQRTVRLSLC